MQRLSYDDLKRLANGIGDGLAARFAEGLSRLSAHAYSAALTVRLNVSTRPPRASWRRWAGLTRRSGSAGQAQSCPPWARSQASMRLTTVIVHRPVVYEDVIRRVHFPAALLEKSSWSDRGPDWVAPCSFPERFGCLAAQYSRVIYRRVLP